MKKKQTKKPYFPYLVDVSITTKCPFSCNFCYQDSKPEGVHADTSFLTTSLRDALFESNVFDICIGGGEPTLHPEIYKVVKAYKEKKFKVAITTKNYNLYSLPKLRLLFQYLDFLAFSCSSIEDLKIIEECVKNFTEDLAIAYAKRSDYIRTGIGLQIILGITPFEDLIHILENTSTITNVTLLGFKHFGRGIGTETYALPKDWASRIKKIQKNKWLKIGADSVLVNQYRKDLLKLKVPEHCLVCKEGIDTCYIDAVNYKMKPSSFSYRSVDIDNTLTSTQFLEIFSRFM